jgi:1,4-alpha-glucan branching enzyme
MKRVISLAAIVLMVFSCKNDSTTERWPYGVNYEVFVRSFADGNGDGIGDIKGLTARLDYLQELGVGGVWL